MSAGMHGEAVLEATWRSMLEATPVHNAAAHAEKTAVDSWEISVPTTKPRWLVPPISFVVRPPKRRKIQLDGVGGFVWDMCDGDRTVEAIVESFAARHRLTFHESRVAVTGFLKDLLQRGALAVVMQNGRATRA